MEGMGHFIAYSNKAIKAVFEDRTLVRMMHGCDVIRILNKKGEEYFFNVNKPNLLFNEYRNYVKVAEEFYEWAFLSKEEREAKEQDELLHQAIVEQEMQKIQRTLYSMDTSTFKQPNYTTGDDDLARDQTLNYEGLGIAEAEKEMHVNSA
jgi:hypothetical protein